MNTQFHRLFTSLSKQEKADFAAYLRSPYLNNKSFLIETLYAEVEEAFLSVPQEQRQAACENWKTLSGVQQRLQRSELLAQLENFLGDQFDADTLGFYRHINLKYSLRERQQLLRYRTNDRKSDKFLAQHKDSAKKSRLAYELAAERLDGKLKARSLTWADVANLQQLHERNFLLESLRLACDGLSAKVVDKEEVSERLLPLLLTYLGEGAFADDPLVQMYRHCYEALSDSTNDAAFYQLQAALQETANIDSQEARDLILLAVNACIRRINSNRPDGEHFAFQLYNLGLDKGYLLEKGQLSRFTFNNIVALALKTGDKQRAEEFVDRYARLLPTAYAQSTEALNRARLAFEFGRLEEAMEYLQSAKDQEVLTTLNIRILQMRVYYELSEFRLLDAHLDALDIYLRRRKEKLGYRYKIYRNLVAYVRRYRRLNPYDKAALAKFRADIQAEEQLPERGWLLRVSGES